MNELAKVTNKLLNLKKSGIFNVSGNERISKYEFGKLIAEKKGISKDFIEKGFISQRKDLVTRPKDMSLSNLKVKNIPEIRINSLKTQINEFI